MRKVGIAGFAVAAFAIGAAVFGASCGQTPVNVPIHTFEGAQKVAVVCLKVNDANGNAITPAVPSLQNLCAPVPPNVVGGPLPYHLISVVTQTTRGELAVVDLTAGYVVDEDKSTPGINFIPVGRNPTDVAVSPDAAWTYVSSAAPTKPAIYAIPNVRLLGDSTATSTPPLLLTDLPACSLPQIPLALAVATIPNASAADGGTGDGGDAGGSGASGAAVKYSILALLGGQGRTPAQVVAIDPTTLTNDVHPTGALPPCTISGATTFSSQLPASWTPGPEWPDGIPYADASLADSEPPVGPPSLCSNTPSDGGSSDGGVPATEVDAGVPQGNGDDDEAGGGDAQAEDATAEDAAVQEMESPDGGAVASGDDASLDAGFAITLGPVAASSPISMVLRDDVHLLYVADATLPVIHVIDVTQPNAPHELEPLLATSVAQPTRVVQLRSGGMALSPPTRDYKRYLYAIDDPGGSLMVFDVTDLSSPHVPMQRPHQELNPLAPADRLTFAAPVAAVAFVQHDWPVQIPGDTVHAFQGLLCNPNQNAHPNPTSFIDLGAYYRADQAGVIQPLGTVEGFPYRLRGIFAFATLTNGTMVTIDVDDWDAPCRRPDPMSAGPITQAGTVYDGGLTGSLDIPQSDAGAAPDSSTFLDPYHAPITYQGIISESAAVTLEPFFPVSAPNRIRSGFLLRNDPTAGVHVPTIAQPPELQDLNGTPVTTLSQPGTLRPLLLPTTLDPGFIDPSQIQNPTEPDPNARTSFPTVVTFPAAKNPPEPGVRLSFDDPTVQQGQDWTVAYEGVLPSSNGIVADITTTNGFHTLNFTTTGANLCGLGIEDWSIGQARATTALEEMESLHLVSNAPPPSGQAPDPRLTLPSWTTDYVEITDDILPQTDPYWGIPSYPASDASASNVNSCWALPGKNDFVDAPNTPAPSSHATARFNFCQAVYGTPGTNPDASVSRDAPILQAYKDHLVVGRFGFKGQLEQTTNRKVDPGSDNNPLSLQLMACCFHKQAAIKVRAGGEWVAVGQNGIGLLHHVVAQPSPDPATSRCVLSCDPRDALVNARSFDVPWAVPDKCTALPPPASAVAIDRNNVLAMRNPMFSYVTWAGCGPLTTPPDAHTLTARDLTWKFSVGGAFSPLTIALSGTNGAAVSPQSMLFIDSLGQLAVVDGAQQGLVLIDLNTVAFSTNYF